MKIIAHGFVKQDDKTEVMCPRCKCVFEYGKDDLCGPYSLLKCPQAGCTFWASKDSYRSDPRKDVRF